MKHLDDVQGAVDDIKGLIEAPKESIEVLLYFVHTYVCTSN